MIDYANVQNTGAPGSEPSWRAEVVHLCVAAANSPARAVLLYGSVALGVGDQWSDVDVLCLVESGRRHRRSLRLHAQTVEVEYLTPDRLARDLRINLRSNNFRLLALHTGQLLWDKQGELLILMARANALWQEGTARLRRKEARELRKAAGRSSEKAQRLAARLLDPTGDAISRQFSEVYLSSIFQQLAAASLRVRRRWVFPLWVVCGLPSDPDFAKLIGRARRFYDTTSAIEDRLQELLALATEVRAAADQLRKRTRSPQS